MCYGSGVGGIVLVMVLVWILDDVVGVDFGVWIVFVLCLVDVLCYD